MNRDEFFAKLSPLDADQLRKVLWTLYWRGSGPLRERIEDELEPGDLDVARKLVQDCLQELPGHQDFISFALEISADLPPRARELAAQRSQWEPDS
jgi:hypothetical protein